MISALTSLSPVNHDRQHAAVRSWLAAELKVFSFNHPSEIAVLRGQAAYKHVTFIPVEETSHALFGKHYVPIHAMCRWAESIDAPVLIINADIELHMSGAHLRAVSQTCEAGLCFFVRQNYDVHHRASQSEAWGLDAFLFHGRQAHIVPDSFLCMGQPWWDYWLPLTFAKQGRPLWAVEFPVMFHRNHPANWSWDNWHRCALEFDRCLRTLGGDRSMEACRAMAASVRADLTRLRTLITKQELDSSRLTSVTAMRNKPLLIYGRPDCGLFSIVFQVLALARWAERNSTKPLVYLGREVCFWQNGGHNGSRNAWEYFFEPISDLTLRDVGLAAEELEVRHTEEVQRKLATNVQTSNEYLWDEIGAFGVPGHTSREQLRRMITAGARYLRVRPVVMAKVDALHASQFRTRTVGVHYRGTDKGKEAPLLPRERYERVLDAQPKDVQFFVATDSTSFLDAMRARYGDRVLTTASSRSASSRPVHLSGGAQVTEQGLIDAILLSRCERVIHGASNLIGGVIIFNPSIDRVDLSVS